MPTYRSEQEREHRTYSLTTPQTHTYKCLININFVLQMGQCNKNHLYTTLSQFCRTHANRGNETENLYTFVCTHMFEDQHSIHMLNFLTSEQTV